MTLRSDTARASQAAAEARNSLVDSYLNYGRTTTGKATTVENINYDDQKEHVINSDSHASEAINWPDKAILTIVPPKGLSCLVGLYNEGNTCYLNSCIQCLVHTMPLAAAMLSRRHMDTKSVIKEGKDRALLAMSDAGMKSPKRTSLLDDNNISRRSNEAISMATEFGDLLRGMWSPSRPPYSVTSARTFLRSLQSWDPQFSGYQQQDAQEAMRAILDGLHESLNQVRNRKYQDIFREYESRPEEELAGITWEYHRSLNDSLIQDIFCGQLQSSIECSVCRRTSHCFDPFLDLSLPLPEHGGSLQLGARIKSSATSNKRRVLSIQDCLALFVASETLSGNDRYKCATCKVPQISTKKLSIYRAPAILVIHLKRFHGNGPFSYKKDDTPVCYPLKGLDLTEFLAMTSRRQYRQGALYDLYAVCHHSGSIGCGHYTAQCKNVNGLWYSFNDSSVTPSDESTIVSSSAYILFYQLQLA